MSTCADCKWWAEWKLEEVVDGFFAVRKYGASSDDFGLQDTRTTEVLRADDRAGDCLRSVRGDRDDGAKLWARDGSGYFAILTTRGTFGCNQWEAP